MKLISLHKSQIIKAVKQVKAHVRAGHPVSSYAQRKRDGDETPIFGRPWQQIKDMQQGTYKPEPLRRTPGKDYGADPLGDGKFRMVPSGDIVDYEERMRRLPAKKSHTVAVTLRKHLMGMHDQHTHANRGGGLAEPIKEHGGITYNPVRHKAKEAPQRGFALSLAKNTEEVIEGPVDTAALRARLKTYVREHWNDIKKPGNYLGAWQDETTGKIYLDVSTVVPDLNQAMQLARKAEQLAVYDLEKNETVTVQ